MTSLRWSARQAPPRSVLVVALGMCACVGESRADWGTYQGGADHTGYVSGVVDTGLFSLRWQTPASTSTLSGLAIGGGTVFVTNYASFSTLDSLHALDQATGQPLWSKAYGTNNDTTSAPAYANGMVYVQTDANSSNFLHAYTARTGAGVFDTPYGAQWETYLHPTPYAGNVYTGGGTFGGMYSYNGATGHQNWSGYVGQYDGWTPAVDANSCYSFTGSGDTVPIYGEFRIIDRNTGATHRLITDTNFQWSGYTMHTAVVLGTHSDAFSTNEPGSVYPNTSPLGRLIMWDLRDDAMHTPHIGWALSEHFTGQATLANNVLYVNNDGWLNARDELTGASLWNWRPQTGAITGNIIATDNLLFVCSANSTYAVDMLSHQQVWSYPISGILAFSDATLYIAGSDHAVYAFSSVPAAGSGALMACCGLLAVRRRRRIDS